MFYNVDSYTFSRDEVMEIIRHDLGTYAPKSGYDAFITANAGQYELVCNTWVLLAAEYTRFGWKYLREQMLQRGLYATISAASEASDSLIRGEEVASPFWRQLVHDVAESFSTHHPASQWMPELDPLKATLMIMRYPKRFTPSHADLLEDSTIQKFLEREKANKKLDRVRCKHAYLIWQLKQVIAEMYPWDKICTEIKAVLSDPANFALTPGICTDAKTPYQKLNKYYSYLPTARHPVFGVQFGYSLGQQGDFYKDLKMLPARLICVPKSYKTYRLIAPEPTIRALRAKAISQVLDKYILQDEHIPLKDQEVQRNLAYLGSLYPSIYATIDMTMASDSISKGLWRDVFPEEYVTLVDPYLPTYIEVKGRRNLVYCFATSGNPLTFNNESILFRGIDRLGTYYTVMFGDHNAIDPYVFGDDQVVATSAAQTIIDLLRIFGFVVNEDKSFFGQHPFREACGRDYYDGFDVSSIYWPRKVLEGQTVGDVLSNQRVTRDTFTESIEASVNVLIALQQRLYYFAPGSAMYLADVIAKHCSSLTVGAPGSRQNEVWGYSQSDLRRRSPYGKITKHESVWFPTSYSLDRLSDEEWDELTGHTQFLQGEPYARVVVCRPSGYPGYDDPAVLHYCYTQYLKHGPSYTSELDKLLGISQSRAKEVFTTTPKPETVVIPK